MKKAILFSLVSFFVIFCWSLIPAIKQAEAVTSVQLKSPSDSSKVKATKPIFKWTTVRDLGEIRKKYHVVVARDFNLTDRVWEDSNIVHPKDTVVYEGPSLAQWGTYFWSVRVQVDSIRTIGNITDTVFVGWYKFVSPFVFFYTTATLIEIPASLPTIQEGIVWAADKDTILVKPGIYYENLRFHKKGVVLASYFARNGDTTIINKTIIDGDSLTWTEDHGSVIYFASGVDSTSAVIGFTIRNGKGTKADVGAVEKVTGGGIYCAPGSTPTIAHNVITQNHAPDDGGGIFCHEAAPNIFNNIITQNSAGGSGAGIGCYYSIRIKPSGSLSPPGVEGEEDDKIGIMPKPGFSSIRQAEKTSPSSESNSKIKNDDLENSLYPKDATEVLYAPPSDPLSKAVQDTNHPPVAVLRHHPDKPKYFVGDTIWLVGYESYDPDSLKGDSIFYYLYQAYMWKDCQDLADTGTWQKAGFPGPPPLRYDSTTFPVRAGDGGIYKFWLFVQDAPPNRLYSAPSDTIYINIQREPTADAGDTLGIAPGDTAWLDGSASCDINPDDTTLTYDWTQILGPIDVDTIIDTTTVPPETTIVADTLWVTLVDTSLIIDTTLVDCDTLIDTTIVDTTIVIDTTIVDCDTLIDTTTYYHPATPYFVTEDNPNYLGSYGFQLKVCDVIDCTMDTAVVVASNPPVAVAPPESLFGYDINKPVPLDGSRSWDPDSAKGDYVRYFIWKGLTRTFCPTCDTCKRTENFSSRMWNQSGTILESTKETTYVEFKMGGIYEFSLSVKDKFGVESENTDTLKISVQLRPTANAGPDTIIRPKQYVYLHGDATCEVNWDQKGSLTYEWVQDTSGGVARYTLSAPNSQKTSFGPVSISGVYRVSLRVTDPLGASSRPDDTVRVIVNEPPHIDSVIQKQNSFAEGDTVELKVWAHDIDAAIFGGTLKYKWTATNWPDYPEITYKPALIDFTKETVKFLPLMRGDYGLQVTVHDTISPKQYPDTIRGLNLVTVTAKVETTLAHPVIMGNLISFNTAGLKGGGIHCLRSSSNIVNNVFYKNKSNSSGGAVCSENATPQIWNNIFFGNTSRDSTGGGIADLKPELSPAASIGYKNKSIISYNDFWNNPGGDLYQPPAETFSNIDTFPRLVDPEYGDFRLECSSPCIGAGKDSSDIGSLEYFQPCLNIDTLRMVSLSLFQNPVATAVAHFLVNTDVPLKAPPVGYVTIGENSPVLVSFTNVYSTTYRGDFIFTSSDTAHITIFASSVLEQDTSITRDFAVQLIETGKIGKLVSHDNRLTVLFPQGVAKGEIYASCIPVSDDPQYNFEDEEKVALGEAYQVGPQSDFQKELTISFPLDGYDLTEKDKTLFSVYKYEKNNWEKQASFLDENSICATVKKLGVFRLVYDAKQEHITGIPRTYELFQNYPNPFNPQTLIKYDLPNPGPVNITVYNILGQRVKTLVDSHQDAGHKSVNWDGKDDKGEGVASGIYFYKIKTEGFEKTKKMILLK
jgi:hypothetical protein